MTRLSSAGASTDCGQYNPFGDREWCDLIGGLECRGAARVRNVKKRKEENQKCKQMRSSMLRQKKDRRRCQQKVTKRRSMLEEDGG